MNARRIDENVILDALRRARDGMFNGTDDRIVTKAHMMLAARGVLRETVQRVYDTRFKIQDGV